MPLKLLLTTPLSTRREDEGNNTPPSSLASDAESEEELELDQEEPFQPSAPASDAESEEKELELDQKEPFQPSGPASDVESEESEFLASLPPGTKEFVQKFAQHKGLSLKEMTAPDFIEDMGDYIESLDQLFEQYLFPIFNSFGSEFQPPAHTLPVYFQELARRWAALTTQQNAFKESLSHSTALLRAQIDEKVRQRVVLQRKKEKLKEEWEITERQHRTTLAQLSHKYAESLAPHEKERQSLDAKWGASWPQYEAELKILEEQYAELRAPYDKQLKELTEQWKTSQAQYKREESLLEEEENAFLKQVGKKQGARSHQKDEFNAAHAKKERTMEEEWRAFVAQHHERRQKADETERAQLDEEYNEKLTANNKQNADNHKEFMEFYDSLDKSWSEQNLEWKKIHAYMEEKRKSLEAEKVTPETLYEAAKEKLGQQLEELTTKHKQERERKSAARDQLQEVLLRSTNEIREKEQNLRDQGRREVEELNQKHALSKKQHDQACYEAESSLIALQESITQLSKELKPFQEIAKLWSDAAPSA